MLRSSIFLKLIFCQKKFSSAVNFRKVKSIYKSKHKHEVMKTRRAWGVTGSQAAEFTAGADLAGKCGGTSFSFSIVMQGGGRARKRWTTYVYVCRSLLGFRDDCRETWHSKRANFKELESGRDSWLSSLVASRSLLISSILPKEVNITF